MPCLSTNGWDRVFCRGSIQFCHWVWLQRLWNLRNQKLSGSLLKFWHWQPRSQHHLFSEQRPPSRPQGGLFSQQMLEAWFHWFPSMRSRCKLTCQPLIIYIYYVYVSILRSRYTIICNYIYNIYIYPVSTQVTDSLGWLATSFQVVGPPGHCSGQRCMVQWGSESGSPQWRW